MKKNTCLLLLFLVTYGICQAQMLPQFYFYKGDTLDGFDMSGCFVNAHKANIDAHDMRGYVKQQEMAFVRTKYHLPQISRKITPVNPIVTAACNNLGFEAGTFANWTGATGSNANSQQPLSATTAGFINLGLNSAETSCSYQTLVNAAAGNDPWGGFPMLDPGGGTFACRLGGENANFWNTCNKPASFASPGELIQQTFAVTTANAMLTYN